jgi:hypothetical protein
MFSVDSQSTSEPFKLGVSAPELTWLGVTKLTLRGTGATRRAFFKFPRTATAYAMANVSSSKYLLMRYLRN